MVIQRDGMLAGIVGGVISGAATFTLLNYFSTEVQRPELSDAVSIANTYIVFTTIIFVAITLFLTAAGLWFTQQFAASKELQIKYLVSEIERQLRGNEGDLGIKLVDNALANPDVSRHVQKNLHAKLQMLVDEFKDRTRNEHLAADELSNQWRRGGKE